MRDKVKIYVAGHQGMVGSALVRSLQRSDAVEVITRSRSQLDLVNQKDVQDFFESNELDQVYIAAAKVGGIHANNTYPAAFIYENLLIATNLIHSAFRTGVKKLIFLGSSCIYPRNSYQPMPEGALLSGALEPTNEPYAISKIAGIKLCESYNRQYGISHGVDFRSVMPCNLYGPGDNYHPENSHVIPALIRRFHLAKMMNKPSVMIWGSGNPRREFLYVDDLAEACIHIMNVDKAVYKKFTKPMLGHINVGSGSDIAIRDLARTVGEVIGYDGEINCDLSKPDGTMRKLIDSSLAESLGWRPKIKLRQGLERTYEEFLSSRAYELQGEAND